MNYGEDERQRTMQAQEACSNNVRVHMDSQSCNRPARKRAACISWTVSACNINAYSNQLGFLDCLFCIHCRVCRFHIRYDHHIQTAPISGNNPVCPATFRCCRILYRVLLDNIRPGNMCNRRKHISCTDYHRSDSAEIPNCLASEQHRQIPVRQHTCQKTDNIRINT